MRRQIATIGAALAIVTTFSGCAARRSHVYEPRLDLSLLAPDLTAPDNAFTLLAEVHTEGRFACPLAVAKFGWAGEDTTPALVPQTLSPEEEAHWTEQVRGVNALRDVIFLRPLTVRPEEPTVPNLCAAARRLGAPLLLVYAPNLFGPNSAQVFGVLYDTASCHALAVLHVSRVFRDEEGGEVSPAEKRGDHRDVDARYQAQRAFEAQTVACLRELIHRDAPAPSTQPHHWQQPLTERWWIRMRR